MPRKARLDCPGALHHVMVRGIEGCRIFRWEADRRDLLERFATQFAEGGSRVYAWSLMPNHFHLLLRSGPVPLSTLMRRILTGYASAFNRRHGRAGHLFQNRFKSVLVEEEPYFLQLVRYIHLNPLRTGIVTDMDGLDRYPWSGHAVAMGHSDNAWQDCQALLERFGPEPEQARQAYRDFVAKGIDQGHREDLAGGGLLRSTGGWAMVQQLKRGREHWASDERILGGSEFVQRILEESEAIRPGQAAVMTAAQGLPMLIARVAGLCGLRVAELTSGSKRSGVVEARAVVCHLAVRGIGLPIKTVARALGVSGQSVLRGMASGARVMQNRGIQEVELLNGKNGATSP